jgi:hypothetical protein
MAKLNNEKNNGDVMGDYPARVHRSAASAGDLRPELPFLRSPHFGCSQSLTTFSSTTASSCTVK